MVMGSTTLKMKNTIFLQNLIPCIMISLIAYIVTAHKIQTNPNGANFIDSQIFTISCISITCLNSTPQYKRNVPTTTTIFIFQIIYLAQASF